MFAVQVIDNRSENKQPDQDNALENQDKGTEPKDKEHNLVEGQNEQYKQENYSNGSQYEDEEPSYEEYNGYKQLSDEDKLVYIQVIRENKASTSLALTQTESVVWNLHQLCKMSISLAPMLLDNTTWQPH